MPGAYGDPKPEILEPSTLLLRGPREILPAPFTLEVGIKVPMSGTNSVVLLIWIATNGS